MIVTKYRCIFCDENLYRLEDGESYFDREKNVEIFSLDCDEHTVTCLICNIHYLPCRICNKFCQFLSINEDDDLLVNFEDKDINHITDAYMENHDPIVGPDGGNILKWRCNHCKTAYETCDK